MKSLAARCFPHLPLWSALLALLALTAPMQVAIYYILTSYLPSRWAAPPQYDMLYMTNYAPGAASGVTFEIENEKLKLYYVGHNFGFGWPRLFRFNPASGKAHEIRLPQSDIPLVDVASRIPLAEGEVLKRELVVPALQNWRVSGAPLTPDGYRFEPLDESREDLWVLFSPNPKPLLGRIVKAGTRLDVVAPPGPRTRQAVTFLGWVLS